MTDTPDSPQAPGDDPSQMNDTDWLNWLSKSYPSMAAKPATSAPPATAPSSTSAPPTNSDAQATPGLAPLSSNMRGLLNGISIPESAGRYDVRYGGAQGPQTFTDYSRHPDIHAAIPGSNLTSSAAGRYQMITPTWNFAAKMLGLKDFSPQSQDQAAAFTATRAYQQATGRDLETDLNDPTKFADISSALHGQWGTLNATNIATGMGQPPPVLAGLPPAPQIAAAPTAPTPATTPIINSQFAQLQKLALLNRLMPPQTTANVPQAGNPQFPWVNSILNANKNQNPLQTALQMQQLQAMNNGQSLGYASNPLLQS